MITNEDNGFYRIIQMMCTMVDSQTKNTLPSLQYDLDTTLGMPNFLPGKYAVNVGKEEYLGYIYDEFIKVPENSCSVYDFALVNNGKIIAIGNEQGRCGGITHSCKDDDFAEWVKKSPVYDKIKNLPVASPVELEEPIYRYFNSRKEYEKYKH